MTAAVISLGTALTDNGVSAWLVSMCFPTRISLPPWLLAGLLSLLIFGLLVLIPVSPSVATILAAPLSVIAVEGGYSPKLLFAVMTICIGQAYLLPFDSVPLLAYERGYFSPKDLFRVSFPTQLLAIFIISLWVPAAGSLTGG